MVCLDGASTKAAIHLGLVPPGSNEEEAGDFLRAGLKKADTFPFTCALRCLATDPKFIDRLSDVPDEDEEFDVGLVDQRYADLKKPRKRKKKKKVVPVAAAKDKALEKSPCKKFSEAAQKIS